MNPASQTCPIPRGAASSVCRVSTRLFRVLSWVCWLLVGIGAGSSCYGQRVSRPQSNSKKVASTVPQHVLTEALRQANVPGMQLVYTHGPTVTSYNVGVRKAGTSQLVTATSTFQAASLGKVVVAYITLRLRDRGLLTLDTPLLRYCPYPRLQQDPRAQAITARMALAHSTGLPNWTESPLSPNWSASPLALRYTPDSCWNYSGEGYVWLQKVLEHLTGKSLETLAQEEVFQPLHMAHSSFVWHAAFSTTACTGHDEKGQPTTIQQFSQPYGAYSLLTTATDYAIFLQALTTGRGLQPASYQVIRTPSNSASRCRSTSLSPADAAVAWACGVGLVATSHGPALWHWGNNGDFQGFFMAFPDTKESLLLLTNSANGLRLPERLLPLFFGPGQYWAMQWLAEEK